MIILSIGSETWSYDMGGGDMEYKSGTQVYLGIWEPHRGCMRVVKAAGPLHSRPDAAAEFFKREMPGPELGACEYEIWPQPESADAGSVLWHAVGCFDEDTATRVMNRFLKSLAAGKRVPLTRRVCDNISRQLDAAGYAARLGK